jgi:hypothetical protein
VGIGCIGAREPARWIGQTVLRQASEAYQTSDFEALLVNVDASAIFQTGRLRPEGAHSDIWYEETVHLILSLARHTRTRDRTNS